MKSKIFIPAFSMLIPLLLIQQTLNKKISFAHNPITITTSTTKQVDSLKVGREYSGGIIAYIYNSNDEGYGFVKGEIHGLIISKTNLSLMTSWWNESYITTEASDVDLGKGKINSTAIIKQQGNGDYAAKICRDYRGAGYLDWSLPSLIELKKIYQNRKAIGGFVDGYYWSSSEQREDYASDQVAWGINFTTGDELKLNKMIRLCVRAVRYF